MRFGIHRLFPRQRSTRLLRLAGAPGTPSLYANKREMCELFTRKQHELCTEFASVAQIEHQILVSLFSHFEDERRVHRIAIFLWHRYTTEDDARNPVKARHHALAVRIRLQGERAILVGLARSLVAVAIALVEIGNKANRRPAQRFLFVFDLAADRRELGRRRTLAARKRCTEQPSTQQSRNGTGLHPRMLLRYKSEPSITSPPFGVSRACSTPPGVWSASKRT